MILLLLALFPGIVPSVAAASPPVRQPIQADAWRSLPAELLAPDPADRLLALSSLDGTDYEIASWLEIVLRTDPSARVRQAAARRIGLMVQYSRAADWNLDTLRLALAVMPSLPDQMVVAEVLCLVGPASVVAEVLARPEVAVRVAALETLKRRRQEPEVQLVIANARSREAAPELLARYDALLPNRAPVASSSPPVTASPVSPPVTTSPTPPASGTSVRPSSPATSFNWEEEEETSIPTVTSPTKQVLPDEELPEETAAKQTAAKQTAAKETAEEEEVEAFEEEPIGLIDTIDDQPKALFIASTTAYGAYLGGMGAWLAGEAMEATEASHTLGGVAPGMMLGAGVGVGTGLLLRSRLDVPPWATAVYDSGTVMGGVYGWELGRLLIPPDAPAADERAMAASLGGTIAGAGLSVLMTRQEREIYKVLRLDYTTGLGLAAGASLPGLVNQDWSPQMRAGAELSGMVVMGGVGGLANALDLPRPKPATAAVGYAYGLWMGGVTPYVLSPATAADRVWSGVGLGLSLGYADTLAMQLLGEPDGRSIALQGIGMIAGNAMGAGLPMIIGGEGSIRPVLASAALTGLAGQALGYGMAPLYEISADDAYLMTTLGAWTAYQAAGWGLYTSEVEDGGSRAIGVSLLTGGAGVLSTVALGPIMDASAAQSVQLLTAGGWGTWVGGWSARLADLDTAPGWLVMLSGGNAALVGTGIAEGLGWSPDWADVAWINGAGLLGAAGGGLVGVLFLYQDQNWDPLVASTLIGSGVGLIGGGVLAARAPATAAALTLPTDLHPTVQVLPWSGEDGAQGVYVGVSLRE